MTSTASDPFLGLRRSSRDRVLTGLAGGLAARIGVPSLAIRIGLVPLTIFFACIPAAIYLLTAAAIRSEDADSSHLERWLQPGSRLALPIIVAMGIGIAALAGEGGLDGPIRTGTALALIGGGLYLATGRYRRSSTVPAPPPTPSAPSGEAEAPSPSETATTITSPTAPPADPSLTSPAPAASTASTTGPPPPRPPPLSVGASPPAPSARPLAYTVAPSAPRAQRERSMAGPLIVGLALMALAAGAITNAAGADWATPALVGAVSIMIIGGGLFVTGFRGRANALIPLTVLGLAILGVTHVEGMGDLAIGEFRQAPVEIIGDITYEQTVGSLTVDLRRTTFPETSSPPRLTVDMTAGEVVVLVPEGFDYDVRARVELGEISIGDVTLEGDKIEHSAQATDSATIILDLTTTVGRVEVRPS